MCSRSGGGGWSGGGGGPDSKAPCAACKQLRRKCTAECNFAPYFPPEEPQKFANVHRIFGASNVSKLLSHIPAHQRQDAVNCLAYEADARARDPVHGCVGAISLLHAQLLHLQKELDDANADLMRYTTAAAGFDHQESATHVVAHDIVNNHQPYGGMPPLFTPAADQSSSFDHSEVEDAADI
ncbi:unnamed protein product [Cuscuta epithymum]|uniref:LOB domain-containing protein n=1 Tax=Cuscuta epithymum TaxID=186058 RepID=A0AAV0D2A6_9ASTE|nr:unnamed protein product [Cuscuta epithymum]